MGACFHCARQHLVIIGILLLEKLIVGLTGYYPAF